MKFAVLIYKPGFGYLKNHRYNIGDNIQSIAIKRIYEIMGIGEEDIVEINKYELDSYDGEYVILPMANFCALDTPGMFPLSNKIIPLYIGFHLANRIIDSKSVEHLKAYEPIGCRDEYTLKNMRKYGIKSYLSGCITSTFPLREIKKSYNKILLIDTPEWIDDVIPIDYRERVEYLTHVDTYTHIPLQDSEIHDINVQAAKRLEFYRNEAELVVTSRLHCASPCIAMGIPTIMVHNLYHYTFWAVDKFIPVYLEKNKENIDWHPESINYELVKSQTEKLFVDELKRAYSNNCDRMTISEFYESANRDEFDNGYKDIVTIPGEKSIKCSIWGANMHASAILDAIHNVYDSYEVLDIIDEYKEGSFEGYDLKKLDTIKNHPEDIVYFITANAAYEKAKEIFNELGRKVILVK